jgi:hypothetical protein
MAQSTTVVSACNAVVSLDNASGTLTDISGAVNDVQISIQNLIGEYRHAGDDWPDRYLLGKDGSASLIALYSTAADEALEILRDWSTAAVSGSDARTLRVEVPDGAAGSDRYEAEVQIEQLVVPLNSSEAGPVVVNASLLVSGALTRTAIT